VGTIPQELNSLELTGEPVMVQKRRNTQATNRSARGNRKKQLLPNRLTEDRKLEAPTAANRALGLMSIQSAAVDQKRPLSPGGTPQDAQSQVKRTKKPSGTQRKQRKQRSTI